MKRFEVGSRQAISISGDIVLSDYERFKALVSDFREGDVVALDSDGGTAFSALEIGKLIRSKSLSTFVGSRSVCTSACALIWVAGARRVIVDGGRVGFHASYLNENGRMIETGVGNAMVGRYLTLLGLSEKAVVFATLASPDEIAWLTWSNREEAEIDFEAAEASDVQADEDDGEGRGTFFERWSGAWEVYGFDEDCWAKRVFDDGTELLFSLERKPELELYVAVRNPKWRSIEDDRDYSLIVETDRSIYHETASGHRDEALEPGIVYFTRRPGDLLSDVLTSSGIEFRYSGKSLGRLSLAGSTAAFRVMEQCLVEAAD